MNILQLSAHYYPNIGGVETHLSDLVKGLIEKKHQVTVLTYQPLTTDTTAPFYQTEKNLIIYRLPWLKGLFYRLIKFPVLEFIYLLPGLFFVTPIIVLKRNIQVIHAHGLVAGFTGVFWGKLLGKRVIISTHSLYHFPKTGFYSFFVKQIFNQADTVLCLSKKSVNEVLGLGVKKDIVKQFTYWIDLKKFKPVDEKNIKARFNLSKKFVVLFVGRLIEEKGIKETIKACQNLKDDFQLVIAGDGPLRDYVVESVRRYDSLKYVGRLEGNELVSYYNVADILIVPSTHEEGFGRVVLEALACGTPVLASNRGSLNEAMDETVGRFITVNKKNISTMLTFFKKHPNEVKNLAKNARRYAVKKYSNKNLDQIIKYYPSF